MVTTDPTHERTDAAAGCPEVLTTDLSRNDVLDPVVEWPPAPPTRSAPGSGTTAATPAADPDEGRVGQPVGGVEDATVAQLAAGRATQLLEASIDHLRTVLETSPDEQTSARVERTIGEVSDACERLHALAHDTPLR